MYSRTDRYVYELIDRPMDLQRQNNRRTADRWTKRLRNGDSYTVLTRSHQGPKQRKIYKEREKRFIQLMSNWNGTEITLSPDDGNSQAME